MKLTADQASTYKVMIEGRESFKNQYNRMQCNKPYNIRLNVILLDELECIYYEDQYKTAEETELLHEILKEHGRITEIDMCDLMCN